MRRKLKSRYITSGSLFIWVLPLLIFSGLHIARGQDSSIKTVYIVPTSHYDFGFVDPPEQFANARLVTSTR